MPQYRFAVALGLIMLMGSTGSSVLAQDFPADWFYPNRRPALIATEGKPRTALDVANWIGDAVDLESLRGQIVIVDFWATWCGPCMRALPKNVVLADEYRDAGVTFLGVHDARRGSERMAAVAENMSINYPLAIDQGSRSARAWGLSFWPTYYAIDGDGVIRGAGLRPDKVEDAIQKLVAEAAAASSSAGTPVEIPAEWLEAPKNGDRSRLDDLIASEELPALSSEIWLNSEPLAFEDLVGKVVLIDFWATWCGPCLRSIPHMNELMAKYEDDLVIIAVCNQRGLEKVNQTVDERGIKYPVVGDRDGSIVGAYKPDGYPDYYFIDRHGKLRIADCKNAHVDDAIKVLVAEKGPVQDG